MEFIRSISGCISRLPQRRAEASDHPRQIDCMELPGSCDSGCLGGDGKLTGLQDLRWPARDKHDLDLLGGVSQYRVEPVDPTWVALAEMINGADWR
jgi:hypothetical protein